MRYDISKLVRARLRLGWDQTKLAYLVGLSVAQVCRIEKGKFQKPATISKMAHVLGVTMDDLLIDDKKPKRRRRQARAKKGNGHENQASGNGGTDSPKSPKTAASAESPVPSASGGQRTSRGSKRPAVA